MRTGLVLPLLATIVIGLALGSLINFGFAFLAIPIVLFIMLNAFLVTEMTQKRRRVGQLRRFRQSARAKKVDFTDEDKRTVAT
jgi:uncharacterized protein YacL